MNPANPPFQYLDLNCSNPHFLYNNLLPALPTRRSALASRGSALMTAPSMRNSPWHTAVFHQIRDESNYLHTTKRSSVLITDAVNAFCFHFLLTFLISYVVLKHYKNHFQNNRTQISLCQYFVTFNLFHLPFLFPDRILMCSLELIM